MRLLVVVVSIAALALPLHAATCGPTPATGCHAGAPGTGLLILLNYPNPTRDELTWRWNRGDQTTLAELGDPLTSTSYAFCLYDASAGPQPLSNLAVPAGGFCSRKPCWKKLRNGFKYQSRLYTPDGVFGLRLKAAGPGAATVRLGAAGPVFVMPPIPFTPPVVVQLLNTENGACWQATYSNFLENEDYRIKARND